MRVSFDIRMIDGNLHMADHILWGDNEPPDAAVLGFEEGEVCGRCGCPGIIALAKAVGCCCHINPPCGACTDPARIHCPICGWRDER